KRLLDSDRRERRWCGALQLDPLVVRNAEALDLRDDNDVGIPSILHDLGEKAEAVFLVDMLKEVSGSLLECTSLAAGAAQRIVSRPVFTRAPNSPTANPKQTLIPTAQGPNTFPCDS